MYYINFCSLQFGSSSPCLSILETVARPQINMSANFWDNVCRVALKHLPQLLTSHVQSIRTLGQLLKTHPFEPILLNLGEGYTGSPCPCRYGDLIHRKSLNPICNLSYKFLSIVTIPNRDENVYPIFISF